MKFVSDHLFVIVICVFVVMALAILGSARYKRTEQQDKQDAITRSCKCDPETRDVRATYISRCVRFGGPHFAECELQARKLYCCGE